jgi:phosphate transport system protein
VARASFHQELDQLRLQVDLMAAHVGLALERMSAVLATGDPDVAADALRADDQVDAMLVSLTERTYDLIRREQPVASDLRYLVSVLRVLEELERIGDLSLRVVKQAPERAGLVDRQRLFVRLVTMAEATRDLFRLALDAWMAQDTAGAVDLEARRAAMDAQYDALLDDILDLDGVDAVRVAVTAVLVGRAIKRIADHTVIVGERLRYLLTGDPAYLASEVR